MKFEHATLTTSRGSGQRSTTPPATSFEAAINDDALQRFYCNSLLGARLKRSASDDFAPPAGTQFEFDLQAVIIPRGMHLIESLEDDVVDVKRDPNGDPIGVENLINRPILNLPAGGEERGEALLMFNLAPSPSSLPQATQPTAAVQSSYREHCCRTGGRGGGRGEGSNGKACAKVVQQRSAASITASAAAATSAVDYLAVVWYWAETYPYPNLKPNQTLSETDRLYFELYGRFQKPYVKLLATMMPNGLIAWIPVPDDAGGIQPRRVDSFVKSFLANNPNSNLVLSELTFLDGPDIFIAETNFD